MNKKIARIVVLAVLIAVGGYFGLMQFKDTTPVLAEGFGILQPEIEIRNIYPGYTATLPLTILCGKDCGKIFAVTLEQANPNKLKNGYVALPEDAYSWFKIMPNSYQGGTWKWDRLEFPGDTDFGGPLLVAAGHYRQLAITLTMPESSDYYGKETEVRVRVSQLSTTGLVQVAIESRWYIITASSESMES